MNDIRVFVPSTKKERKVDSTSLVFKSHGVYDSVPDTYTYFPVSPIPAHPRLPGWLSKIVKRLKDKRAAKRYEWMVSNGYLQDFSFTDDQAYEWLMKVGSLYHPFNTEQSFEYKVTTVNLDRLGEIIFHGLSSYDRHLWEQGHEIERIILGFKEAQALMDHDQAGVITQFQLAQNYNVRTLVGPFGRKGMTLPGGVWIQVLPWFDGVLVVPKAE
ncbi:hypothetical protein D1872_51230 [compost metagenome]